MLLSLKEIVTQIEPRDLSLIRSAEAHVVELAMPAWALGRLSELAVQICEMQRTLTPDVSGKKIFTMAGDHGITEEHVSTAPQSVTLQMMDAIGNGQSGVNILAKANHCAVQLVDMGVNGDVLELVNSGKCLDRKIDYGTQNFHKGPAMTRQQAIDAIESAFNVVSDQIENENLHLIGTGELGIGNTTPASAILSTIGRYPVEACTGTGAGLTPEGLNHKIKIIKESLALNQPNPDDGLDVLSKVGGYDIAGIAGTILAAAYHQIPVLVDGFISTAGALIALKLCPTALDYMIASHLSKEPGHRLMMEALGLKPLLDLDLRLGEGSGAATAMNLVESSIRVFNDMATFESANVLDTNINL